MNKRNNPPVAVPTDTNTFVTNKELATALNMDRSGARQYVLKLGYKFKKVRLPNCRNSLCNVVTKSEAEAIIETRKINNPYASVNCGNYRQAPSLAGQRFGKLTAIREAKRAPGTERRWLCECECGNELVVFQQHLTNGHSKSCGCVHRKHQGRHKRAYGIWASMMQRCFNPRNKSYVDYGGRGITVCERWQTAANFLSDMGDPPPGYSLERISNNGNYEPENCRWIERGKQNWNRRNNHMIAFEGESLILKEWAERTGQTTYGLSSRLRRGWSIEEALTTPPGGKRL